MSKTNLKVTANKAIVSTNPTEKIIIFFLSKKVFELFASNVFANFSSFNIYNIKTFYLYII
ncbi:MAG: hypothetical protein K2M43_02000, partial [Mycoplasmoidaceae bacterium]|nr:hypothetical protein [Mycoplasmoidaceae bacterium]